MGAAGTGTILGTASTPTHWQTGQAATTIPRLVTVPVAHAVMDYADLALQLPVHPPRLEPDLLIQQLPQLSSAPPMAGKCATIRNSHKHTPRPAAKA